jgi:RimJ/RimL family protein N-acetyltransferase
VCIRAEEAARLHAAVETPRLALEPLARAHAEELLAPLNDPALYAWFGGDAFESMEALADGWAALARELRAKHDIARVSWVVRERETRRAIGKLDAQINAARVASNVGWMFFRGARGRGLAAESVRALGDHLERSGVVEQRAYITLGNVDSVRVAVRAGFRLTRVLSGTEHFRGIAYDELEYVRGRQF